MSKIINQLNRLSIFASHHSDPRANFLPSDFRPTYTLRVTSGKLSTFGRLLIFSILILNSCGLDVEDSTPPSAPRWVEKSYPEEWPERGIDAHESSGITLEWEPSIDDDIVAYNIYRATYYNLNDSLGDYRQIRRFETASTPKLCYVDEAVEIRSEYWYLINCQDAGGNSSRYSDSVTYTLLPQIGFSSMTPNSLTDTLDAARALIWGYWYAIEMENFCLTILTEENEFVTRVTVLPGNYIGSLETWQIPHETLLDSGNIYQWRIDIDAKYVDGRETAGSESQWATFVYDGD